MRADDLAPLLAAPPAAPVGFRQGIVVAWDSVTSASTVTVAGASLVNLPVIGSPTLTPGDVVAILTVGSSWAILGRLTTPAP